MKLTHLACGNVYLDVSNKVHMLSKGISVSISESGIQLTATVGDLLVSSGVVPAEWYCTQCNSHFDKEGLLENVLTPCSLCMKPTPVKDISYLPALGCLCSDCVEEAKSPKSDDSVVNLVSRLVTGDSIPFINILIANYTL